MRGGTSKGGYFLASDLPAGIAARDAFLLRVMALTMLVGQAAGAAAAVAAASGTIPCAVKVGAVQAELRRQGVELGPLA